ncbi:hypothetical protein HMPREF1084_02764 [Clostridium butyricum 60E.3]|uniref:Uncharacterized protein n=1 Tax=Clostridium butyricum TaxID=1492 RepID=A0A6N3H324_CLOBU|nr:hypothetical protein [Clostridium butyricum]EMU52876.1 hypothetical protein CBDKU1_32480 [Clostridium butyricum DKU-01]ENZ31821.1 hypothetical protein HMPREF1084_02764 [Clostridium butyricum 60E.3]
MNKKKLLGTTLAVLIGLTSSVPVFADTTTSNTSNTITQTSDKCKTRIGHKKNKLTTEQIAEKLNIDITGLSEDEAKAAVKEAMAEKHLAKLQEKASELGINTANLSEDQIRTAVREAMGTENSEKHLAKLQQKAAELGIDTTNLSQDQIKTAVKQAMTKNLQEKAAKLGIDTTNLSEEQIRTAVREAMGTNKERRQAKTEQTTSTSVSNESLADTEN